MARGGCAQTGWRRGHDRDRGGARLEAARAGLRAIDDRAGRRRTRGALPVAVPLGLAIAFVVDRRRGVPGTTTRPTDPSSHPWRGRPLVAAGVEGGLVAVAYAEHLLRLGGRPAAGRAAARWPAAVAARGHAACLGLVAAAATQRLWQRAMRGDRGRGVDAEEPVFGGDEADAAGPAPTVSGGPGSLVPWATLGREGRRHVLTHVRPAPVPTDRPAPGLPDLSIETVMGEPAVATPVQVYVGLDSAPTARERVDLALAEMERTGAFDRSLIMLVSPTGTGLRQLRRRRRGAST